MSLLAELKLYPFNKKSLISLYNKLKHKSPRYYLTYVIQHFFAHFADGMEYIPAYICWNRDENISLKKVIIPESVTEIGERAFDGCKNIIIYGYTDSYAETYATENNIPFVSLGESIGNCDYDYSSELDKWLLNKGTSNSFNYLVKETNFLCPVSVLRQG